MKKILIISVAAMGLSLGACNTPGERAVGGALIGGGAGALIGGLATGRSRGALVGAGVGAAGGAIIGAATTPEPRYAPQPAPCPYGTYRDAYGNIYCR